MPVKEKLIVDAKNGNQPAYIVNIIKGKTMWLIVDGRGKLWSMRIDTHETHEIFNFNSGKVADLGLLPKQKASVTLGVDG